MAMGRWRGERQGTLFIEAEKLAKAEGIENPTNQDLQRLDRNRPAFVDTYRTLLADPPPELIQLFERLPEFTEAA
jgi:hypothetical protein